MLDVILYVVLTLWGILFSGVLGLIAGLIVGDILKIETHKTNKYPGSRQTTPPPPAISGTNRTIRSLFCGLVTAFVSFFIGLYLFPFPAAIIACIGSTTWILVLLLAFYDANA